MGVLRGAARPARRAEPGRALPSRVESGRAGPSLAGRAGPGRAEGRASTPRPGPCCALTALRATGQNRHRPRCI